MRSLDLCTYSTSLKQKPVEKYHRNEKYRTLLLSSLTFPTMLKTTKTNSLESEVILSWQNLLSANGKLFLPFANWKKKCHFGFAAKYFT